MSSLTAELACGVALKAAVLASIEAAHSSLEERRMRVVDIGETPSAHGRESSTKERKDTGTDDAARSRPRLEVEAGLQDLPVNSDKYTSSLFTVVCARWVETEDAVELYAVFARPLVDFLGLDPPSDRNKALGNELTLEYEVDVTTVSSARPERRLVVVKALEVAKLGMCCERGMIQWVDFLFTCGGEEGWFGRRSWGDLVNLRWEFVTKRFLSKLQSVISVFFGRKPKLPPAGPLLSDAVFRLLQAEFLLKDGLRLSLWPTMSVVLQSDQSARELRVASDLSVRLASEGIGWNDTIMREFVDAFRPRVAAIQKSISLLELPNDPPQDLVHHWLLRTRTTGVGAVVEK